MIKKVFLYPERGVKMTYDAIDVAGFVVSTARRNFKDITNLHLQKILYFLEVKHLTDTGRPLFNDDIEAWKLGPVYPSVYHEYKVFGSHNIKFIPKIFKIISDSEEGFTFNNYEYNDDVLPEELRKLLQPNIEVLLNKDPFELVRITHKHEPWLRMKPDILTNKRGLKYDKHELVKYFRENPSLLSEVLQ